MLLTDTLPAFRGAVLALAAAILFGASTPLVQRLGIGMGAFTTAALLYAGAALAGAAMRRPIEREARLVRGDWKRLLAMATLGSVVGPVALAWGLQHTNGASASLMLTLEAFFTGMLAWWLYRETMDTRVRVAMLMLVAGGAVLVVDQGQQGSTRIAGVMAVLLATAAWGADNTLSRALAERDPGRVVMAKAALGASATLVLSLLFREPLPGIPAVLGLTLVGAAGYGLSLRFYLLAQRSFGAARTGSVFAFAPFVGAGLAFALGDRAPSWLMASGGLLMLGGVLVHLAESHRHAHTHDPLEHEHAHDHDDGHHGHVHQPMPPGSHSHAHRHSPVSHAHAHVPDVHHLHRH